MSSVRNCGVFYAEYLVLLGALLSICVTDAADQNRLLAELRPEVPQFQITTWKTEQGLPQNRVECLLQTRDGYLWVGTGVGLARFDGVRFTTYNRTNTPEFRNEVCKALAEDSEGNLWIGTKGGLLLRKEGSFTLFTTEDGLCHDEISAICASKDGGIWIGTGGGVSRYVNGTFINYVNERISDKHVYSLCEDSDGQLWVGFWIGLYKLGLKTGDFSEIWKAPVSLRAGPDNPVRCITGDSDRNVWFGTANGLYRLSKGNVRRFTTSDGLASDQIQALFDVRPGALWAMAGDAICQLDSERFVRLGLPDEMAGVQLHSVTRDREGNYWAGTFNGGLIRLRERALVTRSTRDGLSHDDVWSISEARDGTVWVGTSGGVSRFNAGMPTAQPLVLDQYPSGVSIRSIIEDRFRGLWLATAFAATWHLQQTNDSWLRADLSTGHSQSRVVFEDKAGSVWIGTRETLVRALPVPTWCVERSQRLLNTHGEFWIYKSNEVLRAVGPEHWRYRNGEWEYHPVDIIYHTPERDCKGLVLDPARLREESWTTNLLAGQLSHYDIRAILEGRTGTLWLATAGGGLNQLRDGRFRAFTTKDGLTSNDAWALHEDADGALWIGTKHGLSRFKEGRFSSFTTDQGLFDNLINQILEDDFGCLWIGCKRGIFRVRRSALDDVAEGRASSVNCISFGEADGMLASETNGQVQPAGCKTRDGKLWFPTVRGVVVIDPAKVRENSVLPNVIVEEVRVNDSVVFKDGRTILGQAKSRSSSAAGHGKSPIALPPDSGNLVEIHYTATSLSAPEKVRFKYRLQGQNSDWREADGQRVAHFTNLRPGEYRFQVIASNNHGLWNETGASLGFSIKPHFYQTQWFPVVCGLATVMFGYSLRSWMARRQRMMQELKAQLVLEQERSRIAQDIHDDLGAHLTHIGVLAELANRSLDPQNRAAAHVQKIAAATGESARSLDEIVWALNPQNDSLRSLVAYVCNYAGEYLAAAGIECELRVPEELPSCTIAAQLRHHVFLIVKEALHNTVQHAQAARVTVGFSFEDSRITIELIDDGRGFDFEEAGRLAIGNGLSNMKTRASAVGGSVTVRSDPGRGTTVNLQVPQVLR